jgi:hypothetical protein
LLELSVKEAGVPVEIRTQRLSSRKSHHYQFTSLFANASWKELGKILQGKKLLSHNFNSSVEVRPATLQQWIYMCCCFFWVHGDAVG